MSSSASDFKATIRIIFVQGGTKINVPGIVQIFPYWKYLPSLKRDPECCLHE